MHVQALGNILVILVLGAGAFAIARGLFMMRSARGGSRLGMAADRERQRCMAWVVAGCMFLSIPALVGLVSTPEPSAPNVTVGTP